MRVLRNTIFLYLSLFGGFILSLIQLKILSVWLEPVVLGEFFTVVAFGRIVSGVILLGIPFVLVRYLPKFHAEEEPDKMSSLLLLLVLSYFVLALLVYILLFFFGYKLGFSIYKNEIIGRYVSFAFFVFLVITLFSIIFMAFNGLRKMHLGAGLNLLYLFFLTFLLFVFREGLSISLVLKIYLISVIPSIIIGVLLLYREIGRPKLVKSGLIKEIFPYWKYAMGLGVLSPLFTYLDRLIIGYFLSMPMVALFTIASKIKGWIGRILDIPMEALTPEISHSWEKGEKREVLGGDLKLIIKLLFLLGFVVTTPVLICGKDIINIVSTSAYLGAWVVLWFLGISMILSCIYVPIAAAMRAIGKISLFLITNVIWIFTYVGATLVLIRRFEVAGVGAAYLLATLLTLIFNLGYVAVHHTYLKIDRGFFYKIVGFGLLFGFFAYFVSGYTSGPHWWRFVISALLAGSGYLLFLLRANLFSDYEKSRLSRLVGSDRLQIFKILKF